MAKKHRQYHLEDHDLLRYNRRCLIFYNIFVRFFHLLYFIDAVDSINKVQYLRWEENTNQKSLLISEHNKNVLNGPTTYLMGGCCIGSSKRNN